MRILVVDEEIPYPLNSGKRLRTFNLLKHLTSRHEIVFVCRQHEGVQDVDSTALEKLGIRTIVVQDPVLKKTGLRFYIALVANLLSRNPYVVTSHYSKPLINTIRQEIESKPYDIYHCEWTPYFINLKPFLPANSVVVAHNIESKIWHRNIKVETNPLKKAYIYLQWKKMLEFEPKAFSLFSRIIAVSNQEKATISQWIPENRISVVANGVDVQHFTPMKIPEDPYSLVFTGAMDWRPNVDCMLYFLDEIWPLLLQSFPQSVLTIVGRRPTKALQDRVAKTPSVRLTGTVDDIRPYVAESLVYIAPLRVGGGSRLKILEALSMCKAVVSTTIGAEGLEVIPERDLLIADEPKAFASAIGRLFNDPILRRRLGNAGRSLVKDNYHWNTLSKKLERVWFEASNLTGLSH